MAETICVSSGVITKPRAAFHTTASPGPNASSNGAGKVVLHMT